METMGPIPNSGSRQCVFSDVSPAMPWPRARVRRDDSARRRGIRGFSLAVGTMLAVLLISSVSSAETSPRGELEDFFGRVTAILSVATNAKQARDDVRSLARALFDGPGAARRALGSDWELRTAAEREEFTRSYPGIGRLQSALLVRSLSRSVARSSARKSKVGTAATCSWTI